MYDHVEGSEPGDLTWPWTWEFSEREWIITVGFVVYLVVLAKWLGGGRSAPRPLVAAGMVVVAGLLFGLAIAEVLDGDAAETVGVVAALIVLGIVVPLWPLRWWLLVVVPVGFYAHLLLGFTAAPLLNGLLS